MSTAANPIRTTSASQIFEVMKTNRILEMQSLVLCRDEVIARWLARTLFDLGIAPRFVEEAETAVEAIITIDQEGRILFANPAAGADL